MGAVQQQQESQLAGEAAQCQTEGGTQRSGPSPRVLPAPTHVGPLSRSV